MNTDCQQIRNKGPSILAYCSCSVMRAPAKGCWRPKTFPEKIRRADRIPHKKAALPLIHQLSPPRFLGSLLSYVIPGASTRSVQRDSRGGVSNITYSSKNENGKIRKTTWFLLNRPAITAFLGLFYILTILRCELSKSNGSGSPLGTYSS